jgi:DNA-binding NarL/FixJ family response regulator
VKKTELVSTALSIAAEHPLDLLLFDAGFSAQEASRLLEVCRRQRPNLRCIALANNTEDEQLARAWGVDAVFLKGFPADRFAETVEALLSDRKMAGPPRHLT